MISNKLIKIQGLFFINTAFKIDFQRYLIYIRNKKIEDLILSYGINGIFKIPVRNNKKNRSAIEDT